MTDNVNLIYQIRMTSKHFIVDIYETQREDITNVGVAQCKQSSHYEFLPSAIKKYGICTDNEFIIRIKDRDVINIPYDHMRLNFKPCTRIKFETMLKYFLDKRLQEYVNLNAKQPSLFSLLNQSHIRPIKE
ncbi:MAG: hypothetical protein LBE13_18035 [Bacteroidales bacterium]|jgi:hypothetical protein|nr:hypothetical protein [Bacteroidales bacterium]